MNIASPGDTISVAAGKFIEWSGVQIHKSLTSEFCEPVDQRGVNRPVDGDHDGEALCDIGAYEYVPPIRTEGP